MKVSIIIPNYNTWDLVKRNITACLKYDDDLIEEIIVVDDCSPTLNYIHFPSKVKIIRNETNLHYTKTVNIGLKNAISDILVLLDSDAYPTKPFIKDLILQFEDLNIGCIGFKTINDLGDDSGNFMYFPSAYGLIAGQQIHKFLKKYDRRRNRKIIPFSCAVSFRKNCLKDLNYFDDYFPVLDADIDLCYRIYESKWKLIYHPEIEIYHVGGNSIPKDSKRVLLFYKSRWQLLKKFHLIPFPIITKSLILSRLLLETLIIKLKIILYTDIRPYYKLKLKGRKELIEMVKHFN
ncbi:hypothetical protein A5893_14360 [Pedobacter psychrophilus]|uniref:Glycosyltransferase 2-like domain-containing protein n=1 Tax=Pedobacter psychrophilus TaxID=1826909 RepID=A0A179DDP2_9SPHI|nr:glycosyltransferase [Pedobacter psychrophilus]OAQ38593.1 hypothetical protein A5893_14360 [Pedobacter psychrophilus]